MSVVFVVAGIEGWGHLLVQEFDFLIDSKTYGVVFCFPVLLLASHGLDIDVCWF
jgi:hypothetical protein